MPANTLGGFSLVVVAGEDPVECSAVCAAVGRQLREWDTAPGPGQIPRILACSSPVPSGSGGAVATGVLCAAEALCAAGRLEGLHDTIFEMSPVLILLTDGGLCSCGPPGTGAPPCGCGSLGGTAHAEGREHLSSASLSLLMASSLLGPSPPNGVSICSARAVAHLKPQPTGDAPPPLQHALTLFLGRAHPSAAPGAWGDGGEALLLHLSPTMCARLMAAPLDCCTASGADAGVRAQRKCAFHDVAERLGGEMARVQRDLCTSAVPASAEEYRAAVGPPGGGGSCIINSMLRGEGAMGEGSVVEGCVCEGKLAVGARSLVRGLHTAEDVSVEEGVFLAQLRLRDGRSVLVAVGLHDDVSARKESPSATLLGKPWSELLALAPEEQIWPADVPVNERCLESARLFPLVSAEASGGVRPSLVMPLCDPAAAPEGVAALMKLDRMSLRDLRHLASPHRQAEWNREVQLRRDAEWAEAALRGHSNDCLLPAIRRSATPLEGSSFSGDDFSSNRLFSVFERCSSESDPDVAARAMACMADWLAVRGGEGWGLRSGPGRHAEWSPALDKVYACEGNRGVAVEELATVRRRWLAYGRASPMDFLRSARHYESAAQVLTRKAVETCGNLDERVAGERPPIGETVAMDVPARIDLAGGWLDTPPICYEVGGMVVNAALMLDGKLPIGARATRTEEMVLRLQVEEAEDVTCSELDNIMDYNNPSSPAALLKAALVCAGVVSVKDGAPPLKEQLLITLGSGLHIETWSRVPRGSGLGTSSILAGAILVVIGQAMGKMYTPKGCIHAVMIVEQLLTTGGGWQDQCGGLYPGIKCCRSAPSLPLTVTTEVLNMPADALARINRHLVLVYTGKARLAKTLLQDVLRRWHARIPAVTANLLSLKATAASMREAVLKGDVAAMGRHMSDYWEEKKKMAPGAEPPLVKSLIKAVRDECHGVSVAGAGGGGLLVLLTKEENISERIQALVSGLGGIVHKAEVYSGSIFPP